MTAVAVPNNPGTDTAQTQTFRVDPAHSSAEFAVKHMVFATVKGRFTRIEGAIDFDEAEPTRSSVTATAEAASVDTNDAQRDTHLRSADFFDADEFPTLSFVSRRVEAANRARSYSVVGDLTLHGVTREVVFDARHLGSFSDPWGGKRLALRATTTINRKDFGLQWNMALETGGVMVGDKVKINLEVEAIATS